MTSMMMPDRGNSPTEHWYTHSPVDRSAIGQQKIDQLQRQINSMQDDMQDRQRMIDRLSRLQELEDTKKGLQNKVIGRNSPVTKLLQDEMERLYGRDSVVAMDASRTLVDRNVIEKVIQHRTKEFSAKQQEAAMQAKYLDKERQRLQEARQRISEQRRVLLSSISPGGKIIFTENYPNYGGGVSNVSDYSRSYPNMGYNRGVPTINKYNNNNRSYPSKSYTYGGGIPNEPWTNSPHKMELVKPNGYSLVHGDTYVCNTDFDKKVELTYIPKPKPFHVKEMNMLDEYDVFVTDVPVYSKQNAKVYCKSGPYRKRLINFKDIDKIIGIEKKPHLSSDLYSTEDGEPVSYTDAIHYKLPGGTDYPWAPVIHSVFDSVENRMANSQALPIIVPIQQGIPLPQEREIPKPMEQEETRPKTRVTYKFVPVQAENPTFRYGLPKEKTEKKKKKAKTSKAKYIPISFYDPAWRVWEWKGRRKMS